jgi:hypothetical protein
MLRPPPNRETFIALRATRAATRLVAAIRAGRVTGLAVLHCSRCGRAIAAATDAAHPTGDSGGRVICQLCIRAEQVAAMMMPDLPEPPLDLCLDEVEEWVRTGIVKPFEPDPRLTLTERLRAKFRRRLKPDASL